MVIIKPGHTHLKLADLKDNYKITENSNFSITYSVYDRHRPEKDQEIFALGCEKIGNNLELLKNYIGYLNENNYTALIHCTEFAEKSNKLPIFFKDDECCLIFEGFKESKFGETFKRFCDLPKIFDKTSFNHFEWMIAESMEDSDVVVTLDNKSYFKYMKTWSSYDENGIIYCEYGKPYRNYKKSVSFGGFAGMADLHCH